MWNTILAAIAAVLAATGVFALAPTWLGRSLTIWEDLLYSGLALVVAGCILHYRKSQARKRLADMRDSALW
ncbi:hypothetical protein [Rhodoferax sp. WC2427]|uniref:hypothetical protein n=1 Tax=Rhodoferax sp. WC2427 TaxID=3234144 RepID=UPI0034650C9A